MKHSLTIEFSSKAELLAYLSKGTEGATPTVAAVTAEVANTDAPAALTPAQKAAETKRKKAEEAQRLATTPTQPPSSLGADPFASGQAPATNVAPVQQAAPVAQTHVAPAVAAVQPAVPGSPRDQWNQACIAICEDLKVQPGMDGNKFGQLMVGTLTETGLLPTDKITTMRDDQIGPFYHNLKKKADGYKLSVGTLQVQNQY